MRSIRQKSHWSLILFYSFWLLIFPAYFNFAILDNSDMTPFYACFEDMDQGNLISTLDKKVKIFISTFLMPPPFLADFSLRRLPNFLYQLPALGSKSLILRC